MPITDFYNERLESEQKTKELLNRPREPTTLDKTIFDLKEFCKKNKLVLDYWQSHHRWGHSSHTKIVFNRQKFIGTDRIIIARIHSRYVSIRFNEKAKPSAYNLAKEVAVIFEKYYSERGIRIDTI